MAGCDGRRRVRPAVARSLCLKASGDARPGLIFNVCPLLCYVQDAMTGPDDCPVAPLRASAPKNHRESVDGDTFNLMDMAMANGAGGGAGGETATPPRVPNPFPLPP